MNISQRCLLVLVIITYTLAQTSSQSFDYVIYEIHWRNAEQSEAVTNLPSIYSKYKTIMCMSKNVESMNYILSPTCKCSFWEHQWKISSGARPVQSLKYTVYTASASKKFSILFIRWQRSFSTSFFPFCIQSVVVTGVSEWSISSFLPFCYLTFLSGVLKLIYLK